MGEHNARHSAANRRNGGDHKAAPAGRSAYDSVRKHAYSHRRSHGASRGSGAGAFLRFVTGGGRHSRRVIHLTPHRGPRHGATDVPVRAVWSKVVALVTTAVLVVGVTATPRAFADEIERTSNLANTLTSITVNGQDLSNGGSFTFVPGEAVTMDFAFAESADYQFENGSTMVFALPAGFIPVNDGTLHDLKLTVSGNTLNGSTWRFVRQPDDSYVIEVNINANDPYYDDWDLSNEAQFHIRWSFDLSDDKASIVMPGGKTVEFVPVDHDLNGSKNASFNAETGRITYTVTVTSSNANENIKIHDVMNFDSSLLTFDQSSLQVSTPSNSRANCSTTSSTIDCTVDKLANNESVTLTYDAVIDPEKFMEAVRKAGDDYNAVQAVLNANTNTLSYEGKDIDREELIPTPLPNVNIDSTVSKTGSVTSTNGTVQTITWSMTANSQKQVSLKGSTITDTLTDGNFSGTGVTVTVADGNGNVVRTDNLTWAQVGVNDTANDKTFTYTVPSGDGNYQYDFSYTTTLDTNGIIGSTTATNTVTTKWDYHESTITVDSTVAFPEPTKTGTLSDDKSTVDWVITADIPEDYVDAVTITENLPNIWLSSTQYFDSLRGTPIVKIGDRTLNYGSDYLYATVGSNGTVTGFVITLTDGGIEKAAGKTVTIEVTTDMNEDWVTLASSEYEQKHKNNVSVAVTPEDGDTVTKTADATVTVDEDTPTLDGVQKTLSDASGNTVTSALPAGTASDGMPMWYFKVMASNEMLADGDVTLTDIITGPDGTSISWNDFDLVFESNAASNIYMFDDDGSVSKGVYTSWDGSYNSGKIVECGNAVCVTIPGADDTIWSNSTWDYNNTAYKGFIVAIKVKNEDALERLVQAAANSDDYTLTMTNSIDGHPQATTDFGYEVTPLIKTLATSSGAPASGTEPADGASITDKNGKTYDTVWYFRVMVNKHLIPAGGSTVTDSFDSTLFKVLTVDDFNDEWNMPNNLKQAYSFSGSGDSLSVTGQNTLTTSQMADAVVASNGDVRLNFPEYTGTSDRYWPTGGGEYVGYVYALVPIDDDALASIRDLASDNQNFVGSFGNSASMSTTGGTVTTSVDFTFQEVPLTKESDIRNAMRREIWYTLDINPNKVTVGRTGRIDIYDEMTSNLRFDPTSVTIVDYDTGDSLIAQSSIGVDGTNIRFTVPDSTHVTIRYLARLIGENEYDPTHMSFSNTASITGYESSDSRQGVAVTSSEEGSAELKWIKLLKYEAGNVLKGLSNATFELYLASADGSPTGSPLGSATTGDDGVLVIGNPPSPGCTDENGDGTLTYEGHNCLVPDSPHLFRDTDYVLIETSAPTGYVLDSTPILFNIPSDFGDTGANKWLIGATMRFANAKGSLAVRKVETGAGTQEGGLEGATICLRKADISATDIANATCLTTAPDGTVDFESVEAGNYVLWEFEAPDGYVRDTNEYPVTIAAQYDAERNLTGYQGTVTGLKADPLEEGSYLLENDKVTHGFSVKKVDADSVTTVLEGAEFCLKSTPDGATEQCLTTGSDGLATFNNLETGTYTLTEKTPPSGYKLGDTTSWTVVINGAFTIDGTEITKENGVYTFPVHDPKDDAAVTLPSAGGFDIPLWVKLMGLAAIAYSIGLLYKVSENVAPPARAVAAGGCGSSGGSGGGASGGVPRHKAQRMRHKKEARHKVGSRVIAMG